MREEQVVPSSRSAMGTKGKINMLQFRDSELIDEMRLEGLAGEQGAAEPG